MTLKKMTLLVKGGRKKNCKFGNNKGIMILYQQPDSERDNRLNRFGNGNCMALTFNCSQVKKQLCNDNDHIHDNQSNNGILSLMTVENFTELFSVVLSRPG